MDLQTLWFVLVTVLFIGFFVLEGFDFGVGMLLPFLGRDDGERRRILNTIGPVWDGNEVWLLTAGGAIFAAFPNWYATLFSGFYLAFVLLLLGLIVRGIAIEFRSKDDNPTWRRGWDVALCVGSFLPAVLFGVALSNLLAGVPIDASGRYVGGFLDLLSPYTVLCGLTTLSLFLLHGALFLELKSDEPIRQRALRATRVLGPIATLMVVLAAIGTYLATDFGRLGVNPGMIPALAAGSLLTAGWLVHRGRLGWAFAMTCATIVFVTLTLFVALYPRVMVSSLDASWSLTIYDAASSPRTLRVMSVVAAVFVPLVLLYQGWTYWVFRQRIGRETHLHY